MIPFDRVLLQEIRAPINMDYGCIIVKPKLSKVENLKRQDQRKTSQIQRVVSLRMGLLVAVSDHGAEVEDNKK
jgi:hypothetical protein